METIVAFIFDIRILFLQLTLHKYFTPLQTRFLSAYIKDNEEKIYAEYCLNGWKIWPIIRNTLVIKFHKEAKQEAKGQARKKAKRRRRELLSSKEKYLLQDRYDLFVRYLIQSQEIRDLEKNAKGIDTILYDVENLSKEDALQLMREGKKVKHENYTLGEFLYMKNNRIHTEENYDMGYSYERFWERIQKWETGWSEYKKDRYAPTRIV